MTLDELLSPGGDAPFYRPSLPSSKAFASLTSIPGVLYVTFKGPEFRVTVNSPEALSVVPTKVEGFTVRATVAPASHLDPRFAHQWWRPPDSRSGHGTGSGYAQIGNVGLNLKTGPVHRVSTIMRMDRDVRGTVLPEEERHMSLTAVKDSLSKLKGILEMRSEHDQDAPFVPPTDEFPPIPPVEPEATEAGVSASEIRRRASSLRRTRNVPRPGGLRMDDPTCPPVIPPAPVGTFPTPPPEGDMAPEEGDVRSMIRQRAQQFRRQRHVPRAA